MGETAIYSLRWPERTGQAADGPDGYKDLASDVDDQMIRFKEGSYFNGIIQPIDVPKDTTVELYTALITPVVRGWVTVEYQVSIVAPDIKNNAGWVRGFIGLASDATQPEVRSQRFHNENRGQLWYVCGRMSFSTLDLAPVRWRLKIYNDSLSVSDKLTVHYLPFSVQQYGGKRA